MLQLRNFQGLHNCCKIDLTMDLSLASDDLEQVSELKLVLVVDVGSTSFSSLYWVNWEGEETCGDHS